MKRKNEAEVVRRSTRPAALKATTVTPQKKASVAKKAKVTELSKTKPKDDEIELLPSRRRSVSSTKDNVADGKAMPEKKKVVGASSPAGKRAPPSDKEKPEGDDALMELKTTKAGIKRGKKVVAEDEESLAPLPTAGSLLTRTIIIEACTQCRSFKERAEKVKKGLESAIPGISVKINPQKPRLGYFEITEEKTEVILSLPSMKRPFTPMKALNMDELVEELIGRFK